MYKDKETRSQFVRTVRSVASRSGTPINEVFQKVYDRIERKKKLNVYAAAKSQKKKPLDIIEQHGYMGYALETALNMNFMPKAAHPAETKDPQQQEFVDPETGEIWTE